MITLTLERENDGTTRWRTASIYKFRQRALDYRSMCIYSIRDEKHISDFFHRSGDGLKILKPDTK